MSKNWESPISIIEEIGREMAEAYDAYIVEEVRKVVPHIDKEELVKALEYDIGGSTKKVMRTDEPMQQGMGIG